MTTDTAKDHVVDATISAIAPKAMYGGAGTTVASWLLSSEFGILVGVIIGVAGFFVNWYYKAREDKRKHEEHRVRMKQMTGETQP